MIGFRRVLKGQDAIARMIKRLLQNQGAALASLANVYTASISVRARCTTLDSKSEKNCTYLFMPHSHHVATTTFSFKEGTIPWQS